MKSPTTALYSRGARLNGGHSSAERLFFARPENGMAKVLVKSHTLKLRIASIQLS